MKLVSVNTGLPREVFGENFTVDGLVEEPVHLGDQFYVGSAEVVMTQPPEMF
jgi:MOSC domain-containing protein YiiM